MNSPILKSFLILGVACSGLAYIVSAYTDQERGLILGDTISTTDTSAGGTASASAAIPTGATYPATAVAAPTSISENTDTDSTNTSATATGNYMVPRKPSAISVVIIDQRTVKIQWSGASDNTGVVGYRLFKNGSFLTTVTGTTFTDISVYGGQEYRYFVKARDAAGNESEKSDEKKVFIPLVTVRTGETSVPETASNTTWTATDNGGTLIVKNGAGETVRGNKIESASSRITSQPSSETEKQGVAQKAVSEALRGGLIAPGVNTDVITSDQAVHMPEFQQLDFDHDGVSNAEEVRLGTDPYFSDTDHDGFNDGDEVQTGHDPKKFSPGDGRDAIVKEDVKSVIASGNAAAAQTEFTPQKKEDTRYQVEKVELVKASTPDTKDLVHFSGKALPNTLVTLYIYSTPTVVTVKADADGNWSYDLTADLENGNHEAYVAVTDTTGKVSSYGSGIAFVKTADAITVKPIAEAAQAVSENQSPLERSQMEYFFVAFIAILFFSGAALIVVSRKSSAEI